MITPIPGRVYYDSISLNCFLYLSYDEEKELYNIFNIFYHQKSSNQSLGLKNNNYSRLEHWRELNVPEELEKIYLISCFDAKKAIEMKINYKDN